MTLFQWMKRRLTTITIIFNRSWVQSNRFSQRSPRSNSRSIKRTNRYWPKKSVSTTPLWITTIMRNRLMKTTSNSLTCLDIRWLLQGSSYNIWDILLKTLTSSPIAIKYRLSTTREPGTSNRHYRRRFPNLVPWPTTSI